MPLDHSDPAFAASDRKFDQNQIAAGLLAGQAEISPKYFYNLLGSKLFEAICQLDEYYPTRSEAGIFEKFKHQIGERTGKAVTLIDLGAGNCVKAENLFSVLAPAQYVPVDISSAFLHAAVTALRAKHPTVAVHPLAQDFSDNLALPPQIRAENRLFFYPGSSLGNFTPLQARQFLGRLRHACPGKGGLLIGIDLVKDTARLEAAYDDALGVTAAFNRNILLHVNQCLGTNFNLADWRHRALFNIAQSRIEMHLVATRRLSVHWPGGERQFAVGETIHTENSYKYTRATFLDLLTQAGFGEPTCWTDAENLFLVCHAQAI